MSNRYFKLTTFIIITLTMTGCAISNPKFFSNVEQSTDPTYGYTAENPIKIKNADLSNSINSSYYYLSRLRTYRGNKLNLIIQIATQNPKSHKFSIIDKYLLKPENEVDTIRIYIDPYSKGVVKIPYGLTFENE